MKNGKASWCAICETKSHNTIDCQLNLKNRQNYHAVYQTNAVAQHNEQNNPANDQNGQRYDGRQYECRYDNRRQGYGGRGRFPGNRDARPRRPTQCFTCYKEGHRYADCPYKDKTDLKFCTHCGVGDHLLEDFPTMLEKINTKKNVNVLSCVQKNDVITTKNLHIVTRQGTKTGVDNPIISKIKETNVYPSPLKEKQTYKEATHVFQEIA